MLGDQPWRQGQPGQSSSRPRGRGINVTIEQHPNSWQAIGGREGGTVSALAFSPAYPSDKTVFAATLAGVYRSTNAGLTWQSSSQGLLNPFVDAIAISPDFATDRTLFVGGREAGVSRSTDGGETWESLPFWSAQPPSIAALAISPLFSEDHTVLAGTDDGTVYKTVNRGRTWHAVSRGLPGAAIFGLTIGPGADDDSTVFAATTAGLYRGDHGGTIWTLSGLADQVCQTVLLSSTYDMDQTLFAGTEQDGLFRSTDGGQTWQAINDGLTDLCINGLAISPTFMIDGILLAATAGGIFRSEDSGDHWQLVGEVGSALCITVLPRAALSVADSDASADDPFATYRTVMAGTAHGGIFRSGDAGGQWQPASQGLNARLMVSLVISPSFSSDQTLFCCGLEEGIYRSLDAGVTWQPANDGLASLEVAALAVSPAYAQDSSLIAATAAGVYVSRDGGDHWSAIGGPVPAQTVALAPDFAGGGALLAASPDGLIYLSPDSGTSWQVIEAPFAGDEIATAVFSPRYADDRNLFVATSGRPDEAASSRAGVWRSRDSGRSWERLLDEAHQGRWLSLAIPFSFGDDGAFYIGLGDRVLRPMRRASETRFGERRPIWIGERPGGVRTTVVALTLSPTYAFDQTLFAATSSGVFVSRNAGLSWHPLADGMTDRSIVAVALSPTYADDRLVFAASLGGTIWRVIDHG